VSHSARVAAGRVVVTDSRSRTAAPSCRSVSQRLLCVLLHTTRLWPGATLLRARIDESQL